LRQNIRRKIIHIHLQLPSTGKKRTGSPHTVYILSGQSFSLFWKGTKRRQCLANHIHISTSLCVNSDICTQSDTYHM